MFHARQSCCLDHLETTSVDSTVLNASVQGCFAGPLLEAQSGDFVGPNW
jgi:hypothetical protein